MMRAPFCAVRFVLVVFTTTTAMTGKEPTSTRDEDEASTRPALGCNLAPSYLLEARL